MIREFKKVWKPYLLGMVWFFGLLWPLMGIHADGTLSFVNAFTTWLYIFCVTFVCLVIYVTNKSGVLEVVTDPVVRARDRVATFSRAVPVKVWLALALILALVFPAVTGRYQQDVAIIVLIYICLGLGLNIVIGLAGMLDLGYIAFYGVGAYTYALLSIHYGVSFWMSLPAAAILAAIAGCIIGYPTLRMRGDYLAIVTLGFGEIVRLILNNWMSLTNGPNGILGINAPAIYLPDFSDGFTLEYFYLKKLHYLYYVALALAVFTIIAVHRLNYSRIGRAWESIRED